MMYIYTILGIIWLYLIWLAFFSKTQKTKSKSNSVGKNSIPSEFLKERTITLEDGSFGIRIEFLRQDLSFEEVTDLGQNVFHLKKFIEESRSKKENQKAKIDKSSQVNFPNDPPEFEINFTDDIPEFQETLFEKEAFKLPESENFIKFENLN
jgi:hypothetical protein